MKTIITFLFFTQVALAQNEQHIGYVTPNKDTLFLANVEAGKMIDQLWVGENKFEKPVIIFTDIFTIQEMNRTRSTRKPGVHYIVQQ